MIPVSAQRHSDGRPGRTVVGVRLHDENGLLGKCLPHGTSMRRRLVTHLPLCVRAGSDGLRALSLLV